MVRDSRNRLLDVALRLSGLVVALVAYLAIRHLARGCEARCAPAPAPIDIACAAIGFLGGSASVVLTLLGRHIFDQVEISGIWARQPENASVADQDISSASPII